MPTPEHEDDVLTPEAQRSWKQCLESGRFFEVAVLCNTCAWSDICLVSEDLREQEKCLSCGSTEVTTTVY